MWGSASIQTVDAVASVADCLRLPVLREARLRGGHGGVGAAVRWASSSTTGDACVPGEFRVLAAPAHPALVEAATASGAVALAASRVDAAAAHTATRLQLPIVELPVGPDPDAVATDLLDFVIAAFDTTLASMRRVSARLSAAACDDLRVESIADALAAATGAPVLVEDADFHMLCAVGEGEIDANRAETIRAGGTPPRFRATQAMRRFYAAVAAGTAPRLIPPDQEIGIQLPRLVAPVRAAGELLGYVTLIVPSSSETRRLCAVALEQAVNLVALAIVHRRGIELVGRLETSHVLLDLVDGHAPADMVAARAARLGLALTDPAAPGLLALPPTAQSEGVLRRALALLPAAPPPLCDVIGDRLVVILPGEDRSRQLALLERLRVAVGSPLAVLGRGGPLVDVAAGHGEARRAIDAASRYRRVGTVDGGRLGLVGVLLSGTSDGALGRFTADRLDPLEAYDRREGTALCGSVAAFLDAGGLRQAARCLGVHPNTLAYRLERAQDIGAFDLASADDRLELSVAFRCRRVLGGSS